MIRELSIAEHAQESFFTMPLAPGGDAPSICITLLKAGDMWGEEDTDPPRRRILESLGIDDERSRSLHQIHSKRVLVAEEISPTERDRILVEGDGLVAGTKELFLFVRVADCFPIFLFDYRTHAFGVVHSGWRGTGIAAEAVGVMRERFGSRPEDLVALIGPGIRPCCYDVPHERAVLFRERFGSDTVEPRDGREFLDLAQANANLLADCGVKEMTSIVDCTSCSPFLGSYRRQGPRHFTHMLALIGYFG